MPDSSRRPADPVVWIAVAATYFIAGKLGLSLAFVNASASAVWPPTGIALAALLIYGPRAWPGVFLGAFLVNETTAGSMATSLAIAAGNTGEALVGAWLASRFANGPAAFDRGQDFFKFGLLAGLLSTAISASVGVTSLSVAGFASWHEYGSVWLTWWLGDAAGAIVVTPAVVLWTRNPRIAWSRAQRLEILCFLLALGIVGWIAFFAATSPLAFLIIPLCVWAGFRFGQREAATATCLLSILAMRGTVLGRGSFGAYPPNEAFLLLQVFMAVVSVVGITVGAAVAERRRSEEARVLQAQKRETLGRLVSAVAHDFNNVLTAIRCYTDVLLQSFEDTTPQRADLLEVRKAAERASALTRQLLIFSQRQALEPQVIDLNAVIQVIEPMLRRLIGDSVVITTALAPDVRGIKADVSHIEQVLMNLAVNARDAMPSGGQLTIETRNVVLDGSSGFGKAVHPAKGPYVVLTVTDTGCGMNDLVKSRAFEPFFTTKEPGQGTGLGLATVYDIVEREGGHVCLDSELNRGTTFRLYFPADAVAAVLPIASSPESAPGLVAETIEARG